MADNKKFDVSARGAERLSVASVVLAVFFAACFCLISAWGYIQTRNLQEKQKSYIELTEKYNELNSQYLDLSSQLDASKAEVERLTAELDSANGSLDEYQSLLAEKEEAMAELEKTIATLKETIAALNGQIGESQGEYEILSGQYQALTEKYNQLEHEYTTMQENSTLNVNLMLDDLVFAKCAGITCWGDSLTHSTYPTVLASSVQRNVYNRLPVYEKGYPGMTSEYIMNQAVAQANTYKDTIYVVWIGTNGGWGDGNGENAQVLISQINAILATQSSLSSGKYLVVGISNRTAETGPAVEQALAAAYGTKFLNMREYMVNQAIYDAGIAPTADDLALMAQGRTPASLMGTIWADYDDGLGFIERMDPTHFNDTGYQMAANKIYNTLSSLGYFEEAKAVVQRYQK